MSFNGYFLVRKFNSEKFWFEYITRKILFQNFVLIENYWSAALVMFFEDSMIKV